MAGWLRALLLALGLMVAACGRSTLTPGRAGWSR
jgi:hypothetical protein